MTRHQVPVIVRAAVLLSVASTGLCLTATAQKGLPYDWKQVWSPDSSFGGAFGEHMRFGDVNHDGFLDLIATDFIKAAGGFGAAGKAFVLFGPALVESVELVADDPALSENMGRRGMSVGDANADGELDVLLGSPGYDVAGGLNDNCGRAHLFMGPDFRTDIVLNDPTPQTGGQFGWGALLSDLDGDGRDDVIVGALTKAVASGNVTMGEAGQVWMWDAKNLLGLPTPIFQPKPVSQGYFGRDLIGVPPLSGGPGHDLIISAPGYPPLGLPTGQGQLYRFDGPSLALIGPIASPSQALFGYAQFDGLVDIDGDRVGDLFVDHFDGVAEAALLKGPEFDTALHFFDDPGNSYAGYSNCGAVSDLDRDGNLDVLVCAAGYTSMEGAVYVFWGPDFARYETIGPGWFGVPPQGLGNGLATGDIDGDGFDEIFAQTPGFFSGGIVYVFRRRTLQADADTITIDAGTSVAFTLALSAAQAGNLYLAALSGTDPGEGLILGPGTWLPLLPDSLTTIGLGLLGTPILQNFVGVLDAQGQATFTLNWPAGAGSGLAGTTLHVAAITARPDGTLEVGSNDVQLALVH